jgi:hypothetical protein
VVVVVEALVARLRVLAVVAVLLLFNTRIPLQMPFPQQVLQHLQLQVVSKSIVLREAGA